jgi:single-strand DNA-binding protein
VYVAVIAKQFSLHQKLKNSKRRVNNMSFQTCIFIGNAGKDAEQRYLPSGQPVATFNMAVNRKYSDDNGQEKKETLWLKVSVFGKQAESVSKYVKKGGLVAVEGRLMCDPATGGPRIFKRSDGSSGSAFEVNASNVRFLSGKSDGDNSSPVDDELEF